MMIPWSFPPDMVLLCENADETAKSSNNGNKLNRFIIFYNLFC